MFTRVFCRTKLPNTALLRLYGYTFDKKNIKTTRLRNSFFNGQRERKYYFFFGLKPASHYNYFTNFRFSLSFLNLPSVQSSVALIKTIICMEIIQIPSRIMAGFGWNYVWKTFYEMHFQILVKTQHMLPEKYHRLYINSCKNDVYIS